MSTQKAENNRYAFCLFKVCATNFGDICHAVGQEATEKFLVCEVLPVVIANTLVRALSQAGVGVCVCLIRRNGSSASRALISNISTSEADVFHEGEAAGLWEGGKASPVPEGTTLGDFCCRPPHTHTHWPLPPRPFSRPSRPPFLEHGSTSALLDCRTCGVG